MTSAYYFSPIAALSCVLVMAVNQHLAVVEL